MILEAQQKSEFSKKGYTILRGTQAAQPYLKSIWEEINALAVGFSKEYGTEDLATLIPRLNPLHRKAFYSVLRYLPSLARLASSSFLLDLSKELSLTMPAVMHSYNIRMDGPSEDRFLFHWHQDITYLLGSKNSLTYWIPLTPVNAENGSIEVIEGVNNEQLLPFEYTGTPPVPPQKSMAPSDIKLTEEPKGTGKVVEANPGDIVVFSQFILHRSVPNRSRHMRWTVQIRHADLGDESFRRAGYPFGDATNIFHTDYLKIGKANV